MRTILIDNISNQKESEELRSIVSKDYPEIKVYKSNGFGQIPGIISKIIQRKPEIIISAGGDGTINNIINNLMKSNKDQIKNIKLSVIHGGKANDLARILEIPKDTKQALKQIFKVPSLFFASGFKKNLFPIKS